MTEEDKRDILERLTLEQELRREMGRESKRKSPWEALNSGFVLLLLGSVVSAVLVPEFERNSRREEWRRTTLAENAKYKLEMMRKGLQTLTVLGADDPATMSVFGDIKDETILSVATDQAYRQQLRGLQRKRYGDVAEVRANLVYFQNQDEISTALTDYLSTSSAFFDSVTRYLDVKNGTHGKADLQSDQRIRNMNRDIPAAVTQLDEKYRKVTSLVLVEIGTQERRYEKLDF